MSSTPNPRHPVGQRVATPRRVRKAPSVPSPLPGDASNNPTAAEPDPKIVQAKQDLDAGQVDTDMHATPGLDAERRARLVPGSGS